MILAIYCMIQYFYSSLLASSVVQLDFSTNLCNDFKLTATHQKVMDRKMHLENAHPETLQFKWLHITEGKKRIY